MKISRILALIVMMAVIASCSKDDEPAPNIENAALSFNTDRPVLEVPDGLLTSEDPMAVMAANWVLLANGISTNLLMFDHPAGAVKSTDLITPVNGRTTADEGVVYTWEDPEFGGVAYQIRDGGDKYIFEYFYRGPDDAGWYRYLYAQEMKDRSSGYMTISDVWSDNRGDEIMRWTWTRKGDLFTFSMSSEQDMFRFVVEVNTKTKAGSVVYYEGEMKWYEIIWDAQGKGTWQQFNDEGVVVESGNWT